MDETNNALRPSIARIWRGRPDSRRIHHLQRDAEFLIELPEGVRILEIVASLGAIESQPQIPGAAA